MPLDNPKTLLWLADHRGVNIPKDFAESFKDRDKDVSGVDPEQWAILEAGQEHEFYWDTWSDVMDSAVITIDGIEYAVWQDGDVWLIPNGMEYDEDEGWYWPAEDEEDDEEDAEPKDE
jgi:hypothetical protein